jgi:hypothetical protein
MPGGHWRTFLRLGADAISVSGVAPWRRTNLNRYRHRTDDHSGHDQPQLRGRETRGAGSVSGNDGLPPDG